MTSKQRAAYWKKYARQNAKYERMGAALFDRAIKAAIAPVLVEVAAGRTAPEVIEQYFAVNAIREAYATFYSRVGVAHKAWADKDAASRIKAVAAMVLEYKEDDRGRGGSASAGLGLGFENTGWLNRLRDLVNGFDAATRVRQVSQTIKNKLRETLETAVQSELAPRRIARLLREQTGGIFSRRRAEVIARTETTFVANLAAEQSAKEIAQAAGLQLMKRWIPMLDGVTRDAHRAMSSKPAIPIFEKFLVGGKLMERPGDPAGGPNNVIRCRCTAIYLPADDFEDLFSTGNVSARGFNYEP